MPRKVFAQLGVVVAAGLAASSVFGYEINDRLSIGGVLAGALQCQDLSGAPGFDDECKATAPFQP